MENRLGEARFPVPASSVADQVLSVHLPESLLIPPSFPLPEALGECVYQCAWLHCSGEKQAPKVCVWPPAGEEPLSPPWGGTWI